MWTIYLSRKQAVHYSLLVGRGYWLYYLPHTKQMFYSYNKKQLHLDNFQQHTHYCSVFVTQGFYSHISIFTKVIQIVQHLKDQQNILSQCLLLFISIYIYFFFYFLFQTRKCYRYLGQYYLQHLKGLHIFGYFQFQTFDGILLSQAALLLMKPNKKSFVNQKRPFFPQRPLSASVLAKMNQWSDDK